MKRFWFSIVFLLFVIFSFAALAIAEEAKTDPAPAPASALDNLKKELGLSIYLQGGITYNFINPDPQENGLRVFDHKADSFTLDLAQIMFTKDAPMGGIGYRLKISAGETAKWIHSRGLGISDGEDPAKSDAVDLTEAYVDYLAPVGKGLKLRFGKFATFTGAEVIEAKDDMNYSRGLLFNYAIPFTHTGLMAGYAFSDQVSANLYVVNGWDNTDDNNKGKTLGLSLGYTPIEAAALTFNFLYGPEQTDTSGNNRFLFDWVGTFKPAKNTTLVVNTDYATEKNAAPDGGDAKWWGIAGYAKYDFSESFSGTVRAEYFDDRDAVRTGTAQKVKEITITPEFKVAKAIIVRPEYRHDWSNQEVFDSGSKKNQDTLALGVMYTW